MQVRDEPRSPTGRAMSPKLADFDHAVPDWRPSEKRRQSVHAFGTRCFSAPETFQGFFSEKSDLYSVGVCLYLLMTGKMPYNDQIFDDCGDDNIATYKRLQDAEVDWSCDPWPDQPDCRSLCQSLMAFDQEVRAA